MRSIVLGLDTSNYTTSAALMYSDGELLANLKLPLSVKEGERGLRQSDAVFAHIKNIPIIMGKVQESLNGQKLSAVGVSVKPRNIEDSYMPCFLSGYASAKSISSTQGIPLFCFSHQCGHIMSAIYSSRNFGLLNREFAALHISGGTTEILRVNFKDGSFISELVGGTADLNAGQVIDRVGVRLGLPFPAGPHIEALAQKNTQALKIRHPKVNGMKINFSGLENLAVKCYESTNDKPYVAAYVLKYIEEALIMLCEAYIEKHGEMPILFAGGVMSNKIIRSALEKKFDAHFADPVFSADNAVGIAELTRRVYFSEKK